MSQALVYRDKGVCGQSADALADQLRSLLDPSVAVMQVGAEYLRREFWEDKTVALAMGGGICSLWDEQLQKEGIEKIHQYVAEWGGKYIGNCAGAYYASAESDFQLGPQSIHKTRSLRFFPGRAVGPLVKHEDYLSLEAARAAKVRFKIGGSSEMGYLYYQGGCLFERVQESHGVEVLGTYEGFERAAAVFCRVGKGAAVLHGTHPEFQWTENLSQKPGSLYHQLVKRLSTQELFRQKMWTEIVGKLDLPIKME